MVERQSKRIVVKTPNYAGDFLMCTPAWDAIRAIFPRDENYEIHLLTQDGLSDLAYGQRYCDRVVAPEWNPHTVSSRRVCREIAALGGYDIAICFTRQIRFLRGLRKARVPLRFGYHKADPLRFWLTHGVESTGSKAPFIKSDKIDHYNSIAKAVGEEFGRAVEPSKQPSVLCINPDWKTEARSMLDGLGTGKYYAIAAGSSRWEPNKRWPLQGYLSLVRKVFEREEDLTPVFLFGPDDKDLYSHYQQVFPQELSKRVLTVKPGTARWGHVLAILDSCAFLVSNDTGPLHAAVALGKKVISIFGPTDINRAVYSCDLEHPVSVDVGCNRPVCTMKRCPDKLVCMTAITPDAVASAIDEFVLSRQP